jgi:hypothetical protein
LYSEHYLSTIFEGDIEETFRERKDAESGFATRAAGVIASHLGRNQKCVAAVAHHAENGQPGREQSRVMP